MVVLGDDMEEKQKVKQEPSADAPLPPILSLAWWQEQSTPRLQCLAVHQPACSAPCTVHLETTGTDVCLKQPGVSPSHQAIFDVMKPSLLAGRLRRRRGDWKKKDCDCPVPKMIVTDSQRWCVFELSMNPKWG